MKIAVIKSEKHYRECMQRIEELILLDPSPNSRDGEELELLSLLAETYEKNAFPIARPDPVDAIHFRMHEQDLRQADLVPYFGSRSRVSEFLSRERPLTVPMVRELSAGLGIPAEVLILDSIAPKKDDATAENIDWKRFPISEMCSRGWISAASGKSNLEKRLNAVQKFIEGALGSGPSGILTRRTIKGDAFSWHAYYALTAWQARVLERANEKEFRAKTKFEISKFSDNFFLELVHLSKRPRGPLDAVQMLRENGVSVVIEKHLAKTKLDGAAMLAAFGEPVIGLTLRFDRIDNFWFTLLHECMHVWRHLNKPGDIFLDRLIDKESNADVEKEANRLARDCLISRAQWRSATVRQLPTKAGIKAFAEELNIHPAIVAGRIQNETGNYAVFADMVGRGEVSHLFDKN